MVKMKKGIFYTLGFLFLAGLILSLVAIAYKNFNFSQERFSEILILDKIYNIDSSIKNGFKDIINIKSGITINKGASIIFSEPLPNMNNINDVLDEYEDFLESNFSAAYGISKAPGTFITLWTLRPTSFARFSAFFSIASVISGLNFATTIPIFFILVAIKLK